MKMASSIRSLSCALRGPGDPPFGALAVALVVNFPSNPTAQVCDLEFYGDLVRLARKHHIWVL